MKLTVKLNGTSSNPYHALGLTQNPFPQVAKAEHDQAILRIQSLGGEPITSEQDIRERLHGFSEEFVGGCCKRFVPGEMVTFVVEIPDAAVEPGRIDWANT